MYLHTAPLFLKPCLIDPWGGQQRIHGFTMLALLRSFICNGFNECLAFVYWHASIFSSGLTILMDTTSWWLCDRLAVLFTNMVYVDA